MVTRSGWRLVNFDHPQCLHFFAQNLVYLANEFRIDAFRLDHTATIVHSAAWDDWSGSVRESGSGGGWEFLHGLRHAVRSASRRELHADGRTSAKRVEHDELRRANGLTVGG